MSDLKMTEEQFDALIEYVGAAIDAGPLACGLRKDRAYYAAKALLVAEEEAPEPAPEKCFMCGDAIHDSQRYSVRNNNTESWVFVDKKCARKVQKAGSRGYITTMAHGLVNQLQHIPNTQNLPR